MKSYRQASGGQRLQGLVSYLNDAAPQRLQPQAVSARAAQLNTHDLASLVQVYKLRAAR